MFNSTLKCHRILSSELLINTYCMVQLAMDQQDGKFSVNPDFFDYPIYNLI